MPGLILPRWVGLGPHLALRPTPRKSLKPGPGALPGGREAARGLLDWGMCGAHLQLCEGKAVEPTEGVWPWLGSWAKSTFEVQEGCLPGCCKRRGGSATGSKLALRP